MSIASLPLVAPIEITPSPSPTEFAVGTMSSPGQQKIVVIQFATKHGVNFFFFSVDAAKAMSEQLANAAGAGILIVPAGTVLK